VIIIGPSQTLLLKHKIKRESLKETNIKVSNDNFVIIIGPLQTLLLKHKIKRESLKEN